MENKERGIGAPINSNEKAPDLRVENEKILFDFMNKIGYNFERKDARAGYFFKPSDGKGAVINIYGGVLGIPRDKKITPKEITSKLVDQFGDQLVRDHYKEKGITDIHIPDHSILGVSGKLSDEKDFKEDFASFKDCIINRSGLSNKGESALTRKIIRAVEKTLGIRLNESLSLNKMTIGQDGTVLSIPGKYVSPDDPKFDEYVGKKIYISPNQDGSAKIEVEN